MTRYEGRVGVPLGLCRAISRLAAAPPAMLWQGHMPAQVGAGSWCWGEACLGTAETKQPLLLQTNPHRRAFQAKADPVGSRRTPGPDPGLRTAAPRLAPQ